MVALIIALLAVAGVLIIKKLNKNLDYLLTEEISDIDLTEIADGEYHGEYDATPVVVEVKVTVKDHAITKIDIIKHQNGKGQQAEAIIDNIIEKQSLKVDSITGATYSSKVILLAIEDALKQG